ncbi:MAG: HD domain-containing protein [Candidatus Paraprevotella stercoravium]|uniref:HD domain-containing protein n=1 Tax=Candidatus Paraprevotella stercoravium TaxID=2838725 RepID=A0A9E2L782_9BACT|nr:HD domain-containing protein [Candidatus Paraprevotella stercoravium]
MKMNQECIDYVESEILPRYASFDKAHQNDHVDRVIQESLRLAQYYEVNPDMVYVIAAYHDVGLVEGRERHHLVSGRLLQADQKLRNWFSEEEIQLMKEAVEDHRASNKHEPRSIYGKIVSEADRVIDAETTFRRTVQYGLSHYPEMIPEEHYLRFRDHLITKYGEGGYLKLWIPQSDNAERLQEIRGILKNEVQLRNIFMKLFAAENAVK